MRVSRGQDVKIINAKIILAYLVTIILNICLFIPSLLNSTLMCFSVCLFFVFMMHTLCFT